MPFEKIGKSLCSDIIVFDGAMGTMIQRMVPDYNGSPEMLNVIRPDVIKRIHALYIEAGADVIETNSFGANRIKLSNYGLSDRAYELSFKAAAIAREVAGDRALVAGSVGPLGVLLKPVGNLDFDDAYDAFYEQIKGLKDGGADLIIVETMSDIREAKAAILAAGDQDIPVIALVTFQENGRTLLGTIPESVAIALGAMDVVAIGSNCSTGPDLMVRVAQKMAAVVDKPLLFMPNAGMPKIVDGVTTFPMGPEEYASYFPDFIEAGACIVGGCCGTTPDHIRAIKEKIENVSTVKRHPPQGLKLSGRDRIVFIGRSYYPVMVGERINPTGKKEFQRELVEGKTAWVTKVARSQERAGADVLDVNVGVAGIDEVKVLPFIVSTVQATSGLPVFIDSSSYEAIEAALKICEGRPVINSTTVEEKKITRLMPLAKRFGAAILVLPMDEKGIPSTPDGRVYLGEKALRYAESLGLSIDDILLDLIVTAVSADKMAARVTLEALYEAKRRGFNTVLGVSNVSFGLPNRVLVNSSFLSAALALGLDAAIINPENESIKEAFYAASLISGRDPEAKRFIAFCGIDFKKKGPKGEKTELALEEQLKEAIIYGDEVQARKLTLSLLEDKKPVEIINGILIPAMQVVGDKYDRGEFFLPQLMASARAMKEAFGIIKERFGVSKESIKGRIILATVEGDIHDIGKNIVALMLENHGYEVIDLGKNVPTEKIVEAALKEKPDVVGLSALMTTTMVEMENVISKLKEHGIDVITIVGGAVVTEDFAKKIGASAYARDAVEAVRVLDELIKKKKSFSADSGS